MTTPPGTNEALKARIRFYREMGIFDFYRRPVAVDPDSASDEVQEANLQAANTPEGDLTNAYPDQSENGVTDRYTGEEMPRVKQKARESEQETRPEPMPIITRPVVGDKRKALKAIREDIGDCTRCKLHKLGRKQIVFGVGNVDANIMFVGEGPGADEDQQGEPFVGRAGQLLNNMIRAMGLQREDVYIANVVKCRPPQNRTPEPDECGTCSPFLFRQIETVQPKIMVALGAVAAKNLLAMNDTMGNLRGRIYDCRGTKLVVTYHPAYLLRDPRQKKETWKDLQIVMKYLGMPMPAKGRGENGDLG